MINIRNRFLYLIATVLLVACDAGNMSETAVSANLGSKQTNKVLHDDGILEFN